MALSSTTNRVETGVLSGVTAGQDVTTFPSRISTDEDLKVYEIDSSGVTTKLTLNVHYTLDKTLSGSLITGATVKATAGGISDLKFANGSVIVVIRETDYQQSSNYEPNAIIPADTLENDLDKLAMQTQQLKDNANRAIQFSSTLPASETPEPIITLTATQRANKLLGFSADGSEFAVTQEIGNYRGNWAVGTVYSVRDIVKEPSEASILNNIYICNTSHTAQGSYVTQSDSAKWDLIVDAAAAASSASAASASASAAADDADDAEKLAINAEDIQYTLSDGSTTGYSALHYAAKAAASASGAVNAKNDAETAKGLAEGALNAIRGFYLGAKASNPTQDDNGDPITEGDWYFNTDDNTTRIYNGSSWDVIEALPQALDTTDSPTFAGLDVDNININGNAITSTNTDGNITITPNGTGEVDISKVDIDGGTIDGTDITVGAGKTLNVSAGTLTLADNQISGDKIDGGTISNFASTGIDDNASSGPAVTIDASGNVQLTGSLTAGTIGSGVIFPAGHILNVWSAYKSTEYTHSGGTTWATVSDLSQSITIGSGNKVLILAAIHISASSFDGRRALYRIVRNTPSDPTAIAVSTDKTNNGSGGTTSASSSNGGPFSTVYLDTPSATSVTYSVQVANFDGVLTYLNRLSSSAGAFSSLTLMEIKS